MDNETTKMREGKGKEKKKKIGRKITQQEDDTGNATPAKCRSRGLPVPQAYGLLVHTTPVGGLPERLYCTDCGNFVLLRS
jgi:hypothetical protein